MLALVRLRTLTRSAIAVLALVLAVSGVINGAPGVALAGAGYLVIVMAVASAVRTMRDPIRTGGRRVTLLRRYTPAPCGCTADPCGAR